LARFFRSSGFGSSFGICFTPFSFNCRLLEDPVNVDFNYTLVAIHAGRVETGIVTDGVVPGLEIRLYEIPDVFDHLPGVINKFAGSRFDVITGEVDPCLDQFGIDPRPEFACLLSQDLPSPVRTFLGEDSVLGPPFGGCKQFLGFLSDHLIEVAQGIFISFLCRISFAIGG
jgi:hypothetical protein